MRLLVQTILVRDFVPKPVISLVEKSSVPVKHYLVKSGSLTAPFHGLYPLLRKCPIFKNNHQATNIPLIRHPTEHRTIPLCTIRASERFLYNNYSPTYRDSPLLPSVLSLRHSHYHHRQYMRKDVVMGSIVTCTIRQ